MANYKSDYTGQQIDESVQAFQNKGLKEVKGGVVYRDDDGAFLTANITYDNATLTKTIDDNSYILFNKSTIENDLGKGAANGIAPLDNNSKVSASILEIIETVNNVEKIKSQYLPSYVDDVEEYASVSSFPSTGETGKIYVDTTANKTYRWSGSQYIEISPGSVVVINSVLTGGTPIANYSINGGESQILYAPNISQKIDAAGIGLIKVGDTTVKTKLNSENSLGTLGTTDKLYAVGVDSNGELCINVPWNNNSTTITNTSTYYLIGAPSVATNTDGLNKHGSAYIDVQSDSIVDGETKLTLGNNVDNNTGSKHGILRLYGVGSFYIDLLTSTGLTSNQTVYIPNKTGIIALTSDLPDMDTKQDVLVSGTNIKTVNNVSLIGSGNINLADYQTIFMNNLVDGSATGSVRGIGTTAESSNYTMGQYAFAEGEGTLARGDASHAEGYFTQAEGDYSHAEGSDTLASGDYSHTEGYNTQAEGDYSHAEGNSPQAHGESSHAEGVDTVAYGGGSHAEGDSTHAVGACSHAEGYFTYAEGNYSHAQNYGTSAFSKSQTVLGEWNVTDTTGIASTRGTYAVIVGNGTNLESSNALTIDWNGNVVISGTLTDGNGKTLSAGARIIRWTEV